MAVVVGIDLGTTNSVVAAMRDGKPAALPNAEGARLTPSVVSFSPDGSYIVGEPARRRAALYPDATVFSIKRLMGRSFDDPTVQADRRVLPYKVVEGPGGTAWVEAYGRRYSPPQISAMILQKLALDAAAYLNDTVRAAVITTPAYFNERQVQATRDAARIAGLEVYRIINEPTAAALAYGLDHERDELALIVSIGGGSMDASLLHLGEGVFEVKATIGDTHLGGDDIDMAIVAWLCAEFRSQSGIDLTQNASALQRLKAEAEQAKIDLSSATRAEIHIPYLVAGDQGSQHLHMDLTRSQLDSLMAPVLARVEEPLKRVWAYRDNVSWVKDQDVILVGAQTRSPAIGEFVGRVLDKVPRRGIDPDEAVALGAAIQAGVLTGYVREVLLLDVYPFDLCIETCAEISVPESPLHPAESTSTTIPPNQSEYMITIATLPAAPGPSSLASPEAPGAPRQLTPLIESNTTIPTQKSQVFTTERDQQTTVVAYLVGRRDKEGKDRFALGSLQLDGIAPAPRGVAQIEVMLDIDANHILNMSLRDKGNMREARLTIQPPSQFAGEDIARMADEARAHVERVAAARREREARERAAAAVDDSEKFLRTSSANLSAAARQRVEQAINDLRPVISSAPLAELDTLHTALWRATGDAYSDWAARDGAAREADAAARLLRELGDRLRDETRARVTRTIQETRALTAETPLPTVERLTQALRADLHAAAATVLGQATARGLSVFVSHSHVDNTYCRQFVAELQALQIDVWYDENNLPLGELTPAIEAELMARTALIPILTPASLESAWVRKEAQRFYDLYLSDKRRVILPVLAGPIASEAAIWSFLSDFKRIEGEQMRPYPAAIAAQLALRALTAALHPNQEA